MYDNVFTEELEVARSRIGAGWTELRQYWRDAAAARFEQQYVEPLQDELRTAKAALDELVAVADQCQRLVDQPVD